MLSFSPKYAFLPFALVLFTLSLCGLVSFAFDWKPFSGTNTLIISCFSFLASLGLFSDYLTTRVMFADAYGKPTGFGHWLSKRLVSARYGIDFLYQVCGTGLLLSVSLFSYLTAAKISTIRSLLRR
jgi:hypothetical protein